jgi:hypothetical protein
MSTCLCTAAAVPLPLPVITANAAICTAQQRPTD